MEKFREKIQAILSRIGKKKQPQEPVTELEAYKREIRQRQSHTYIRIGVVVVVVLIGALLIKQFVDHHSSSSYEVLSTIKKSDESATHYISFSQGILRYSSDGASYLGIDGEAKWNNTYAIQNPVSDICDDMVVIYGKEGTNVTVLDENGVVGSFTTEFPIVKARVSSVGSVVAVLANGETTLVNYYASDGSKIADSFSNMTDPGYPVDLDLSEDGNMLVVSYATVQGSGVGTNLVFYDFSKSGQNKKDNISARVKYEDILIPQVIYFDNTTVAAIRDNGFTLYEGGSSPKEKKSQDFDDEIASTFSNDSYFGFIFQSSSSSHPFIMEVYNKNGNFKDSTDVDILYEDINFDNNQIILHNTTDIAAYSVSCNLKFNGVFEEGRVYSVSQVKNNRYLVVYDGGISLIKFK